MKNLIRIHLITIFLNIVYAVGEAGAIFLLITPGAGPAALGEAQVAKADDAYASYFNPAGLAFLYEVDPSKDNFNFDINNDNYLIDPSKDNFDAILNPNGSENNGNYDFGEFYYDYGKDGKPNKYENGYDEKNNPDPNNDDFHPINNPTGSENNGRFDIGETYQDFGIDRTKNEFEFRYSITGTEKNNILDDGENFYDYGIDGLLSKNESGYDPISNPDPNNDNYNAITNPNGTENNSKYDVGELFNDFGIDGIEDGEGEEWGTPIVKFNPNGTEGNNLYDLGERFLDYGIDGIPNYMEPGYNPDPTNDNFSKSNSNGTEKNGKRDDGENFVDEKVKYSKLKLTFTDSLFTFYKNNLDEKEFDVDDFLARSVKYDSISYNINNQNKSIDIIIFPKSSYKVRKVKKLVSRDVDYIEIDGSFGDSLNNRWDWYDTDKNNKFNWDDFGADGIPDYLEKGYDPILNPDPNGDNYSESNKKGKEKNGFWDKGEGDWHEPFDDYGIDNIADEDEPGYLIDPYGDNYDSKLNPKGTENNLKWDPGEEYYDFGEDKKPDYLEKSNKDEEVVLMHVNWLPNLADDLYYEFLGYRKYFPGLGTIGGHFIYLNLGEQMRTDEYGNELYTFRSNMWALALSFGTKISEKSSIGLNMKLIQQNLIDIGTGAEAGKGKSTDFSFDVGYLLKNKRFNFGAAITNIGPKIDFIDPNQADPQPTNLKMGIYWEMYNDGYNKLNLLFDVNKLLVAAYPAMDWDGDGKIGGYDENGNETPGGVYGDYNYEGQLESAHTDPWYKALVTSWLDDWYLGGDIDMAGENSEGDRDGIIGGWSYNENNELIVDPEGIYNEYGVKEKGNKDDRTISTEFEEMVYNLGLEYWYSKYFAIRTGYIYDYEGKIMVPTFGAGIRFGGYGFDFGYTAGEEDHPRANTMYFSINMAF